MTSGSAALRWSPRLPREKLRRLYEQEAQGLYDEKLLDEVGICLYLRCRDILTIARAHLDHQVPCPICDAAGHETIIPRHGGLDERLCCPVCGWEIVWQEYWHSFRRQQLSVGGAGPAFRAYMTRYERARTPREKMLAIDALIHEFHYSLRRCPDLPTRPVLPNLIEGRLSTLVPFLDALTADSGPEHQPSRARVTWEREKERWEQLLAKGVPPETKEADTAGGPSDTKPH